MIARYLALGLLLGCGRLQFTASPDRDGGTSDGADASPDARPCSPIGHDEDGDGVDDACDVCPQRVDNQLDSDGDGVGDACDLAVTAQVRTLFDPFTGPRPADWTVNGGTYMGDVLQFNSPAGGAGDLLVQAPGRDTFELTGQLIAGSATTCSMSIGIGPMTPAVYYCEIYDDGSSILLNLTYTADGINYFQQATTLLPGRLDSGPFRLIMDHTPPTTTCIAEWDGMRASITGAIPNGIAPDSVGFGVFQVVADMQSFVRLTTP